VLEQLRGTRAGFAQRRAFPISLGYRPWLGAARSLRRAGGGGQPVRPARVSPVRPWRRSLRCNRRRGSYCAGAPEPGLGRSLLGPSVPVSDLDRSLLGPSVPISEQTGCSTACGRGAEDTRPGAECAGEPVRGEEGAELDAEESRCRRGTSSARPFAGAPGCAAREDDSAERAPSSCRGYPVSGDEACSGDGSGWHSLERSRCSKSHKPLTVRP
jgi:hypothetical protein